MPRHGNIFKQYYQMRTPPQGGALGKEAVFMLESQLDELGGNKSALYAGTR